MPDAAEGLTDQERRVLAIEKLWWKYTGQKESRVREDLDLSMTAFYQLLNTMLDDPRVYAAEPMLVKRLQRIRQTRHQSRSARRLGFVDS